MSEKTEELGTTTEMNKAEMDDEESQDVTTTENVIDYQEKMKEDQNDDELTGNDVTGSGPKDDDLRAKYIKLVDHNSKLVDLLRTTMALQTDLFRKLIHYIFP